jgi:hypothetical protein
LKRKLLFLVLVAIVIVAAYLYLKPPEPVLSAEKVYNVTVIGETVPLNVTLANVPGTSGWNMRLTWDPYYVRLSGVEEGPLMKTANMSSLFSVTSVDYERGEIILADVFLGQGISVQGTGVILEVNFTTIRIGSSTIEFAGPGNGTQASIGDANNKYTIDHVEVYGLISNEGPPPIWASTDFQNILIVGELAALSLASGLIYWRAHPRPPRLARRREEFQPKIDPEDQVESA